MSEEREWKTGYKVVMQHRDGKMMSCRVFNENARVEYEFDKQAQPLPGNGPLCVFDTAGDAKRFRAWEYLPHDRYPIVRCDYTTSDKPSAWLMLNPALQESAYGKILPPGTVLADVVILRERVVGL